MTSYLNYYVYICTCKKISLRDVTVYRANALVLNLHISDTSPSINVPI